MPFRWRSDGDYIKKLPLTRRIMPHIMRTRTESQVYFEQKINVTQMWEFIRECREKSRITFLQYFIWAGAQTIRKFPDLNRFVAGKRIYQRRGIWVSFSAKKEKTDKSPIVVVKTKIDPEIDFLTTAQMIQNQIAERFSDKKSTTDKELSLAFLLPNFIIGFISRLLMWLDHFGFLPGSMIQKDEMFSSVFIANLGSIGLDAAYHHLFEYGNIPFFVAIGQKKDEAVLDENGNLGVAPIVTIRYTFDERITDGLYCMKALEHLKEMLENPEISVS